MSGTRWSKTHKQGSFGATVCFNGCQTSNVWRQSTSCLATYLDATDGLYIVYAHMWPYLYIGFNSLSPKSDQHQYFLLTILIHHQKKWLWELTNWSIREKCVDLYKAMYGHLYWGILFWRIGIWMLGLKG